MQHVVTTAFCPVSCHALPAHSCASLPSSLTAFPPNKRQDSWSSACTIWEQRSHYVKFRVSPETFYLQIAENYIWRLGRKALNPSLEQVNKEKRQRASFTDLLYNLHLWTTPADLSRSCLWKHRPRKAQRPECTHLFAHKQTAFPNSQQLPGPNSASHHLLVPMKLPKQPWGPSAHCTHSACCLGRGNCSCHHNSTPIRPQGNHHLGSVKHQHVSLLSPRPAGTL